MTVFLDNDLRRLTYYDANERVGRLRQDQFAFETEQVLDVVLMGHAEMWAAMRERDAIYADPEARELLLAPGAQPFDVGGKSPCPCEVE